MSQKTKPGLVVTDPTIADRAGAKEVEAKDSTFVPEPSAAKQSPPEDAMVQQILERQAVFGF